MSQIRTIRQLLLKQVRPAQRRRLRLRQDTNLFDAGILDSLKMLELVMAIEETFAIRLARRRYRLDDFSTIHRILRLIKRRKAGSAPRKPKT